MPIYEYLCEAGGRVVEVSHKIAEKVQTWGELCGRADLAGCGAEPCGSGMCGLQ